MSKRIRKKKEVEKENYDIIQLDNKIKKIIQDESGNIITYKNRLNEINSLFSKSSINQKKRKELCDEKEMLENKIHDIESNNTFSEYICISHKIIDEYLELLKIPSDVNFFVKTKEDNKDDKKEVLLEDFLDIAKKYISDIKPYKKQENKKFSCNCGNINEFVYTENTITCEKCGVEKSIYSIQTSFKDIDRVNLSQKYRYKKRVHFRDTVNQYQGKQNKKIDQKVYDDLEKEFEKLGRLVLTDENGKPKTFHEKHVKITKELIYMLLSETGNNSHYEDINLIHNYFTGIPCPDISHIEQELFDDFDKVVEAYDSLEFTDRTNFLNSQYILYQLLRKRNIKVKEDDFDILKTRDRVIDHDSYLREICLKLEWNFQPSV